MENSSSKKRKVEQTIGMAPGGWVGGEGEGVEKLSSPPTGEDLEDLEVYGIDTRTGPQLHTFKFEVIVCYGCFCGCFWT